MLKYLYNPGSANLPSAEPWASVVICCAGKGVWEPGTGPLATATRNARTWICLSQALDDMPSSKVSPSLSSSVRMTWCRVSPAGPSTKLTGVLGYLPSATCLVLCFEPTAVVRSSPGPGPSCLCAARATAAPVRRRSMTAEFSVPKKRRHLFTSGFGQLVGHRSLHRSVPEASNYNKICLAQISAEDDASAGGSPSAGTQLHFFQPPIIQDTLPNGAACWRCRFL